MDNDDRPIGRVLTRREVLALMGGAGASVLVGCSGGDAGPTVTPTATPARTASGTATPTASATASATAQATATGAPSSNLCVVRPELTEGPYFVDERLNRSDIRTDPSDGTARPGTPLVLAVRVSQVSGGACAALAGAIVDLWHCDALGAYSDIASEGTSGKKFLRGYQVTNSSGVARFTTIYPGWYEGRAVHLHFKIRTGFSSGYDFTSQFFFPESVTDAVHATAPYSSKGQRTIRNENDGIYGQGGSQLVLSLSRSGSGYAATFDIALQL